MYVLMHYLADLISINKYYIPIVFKTQECSQKSNG